MSDSSERPLSRQALTGLLRPCPGEVVLEVGCGPGRVLGELADQLGSRGRVVGVDLSGGMTRQARRHGLRGADAAPIGVLQADALELPLADHSVDAVFMSFTLELFDDAEIGSVLAQLRRVLTPRGRLCLASMASTGSVWPMGQLYEWAHTRAPTLVDCRPLDPLPHLKAAGFAVTEHRQRSLWGLAVDLVLARPGGVGPGSARCRVSRG